MKTKTCTKCLKDKPVSEFNKRAASKDGVRSQCKECARAYSRQYAAEHREEGNVRNRSYRDRHPLKERNRALLRYFNITLAEYDEMLEGQGGGCAICGMTPEDNGKRLAVDHDHETDEVRGLLCNNCNTGIGLLQDNPAVLRSAANYLEAGV